MSCCVVGCSNRYDRDNKARKFYRIPSSNTPYKANKRRLWIQAINRSDWSEDKIKNASICSDHFISGQASDDYYSPDFVPTIFPDPTLEKKRRRRKRREDGTSTTSTTSTSLSTNNGGIKPGAVLCTGLHDVAATHEAEVTVEVEDEEPAEMDLTEDRRPQHRTITTVGRGFVAQVRAVMKTIEPLGQPERAADVKRQKIECEFCEERKAEINRLVEENGQLKSELSHGGLTEEFLKDDTEKVKYYTGLPCLAILLSLLNNVKSFLPAAEDLSHFQMLFLTLMRLRLDLPVQHLCHLFNISHKKQSSAFADTINVLHARLGPLVPWPERHCLLATMPHEFTETFGKRVVIIVDLFEIRTERTSDLKAETHSDFKDTQAVKYLVGISPQGSVLLISKGWGECVSDGRILEKSGLLDKLLPGDVVLTNRGGVGMTCAEVKATKDLRQLEVKDSEETKAFIHLTIHVQRVIGSIRRKYKMLQSAVPTTLRRGEEMTLLDKIMNVCCILSNMCPSVVVKLDENETCSC